MTRGDLFNVCPSSLLSFLLFVDAATNATSSVSSLMACDDVQHCRTVPANQLRIHNILVHLGRFPSRRSRETG
jgi:hypothetical protein